MADPPKDKLPLNTDQNSLDTLSLASIPLTSTTLKNARLIKNTRLETAVELYNDPIAGSLQIYPADIADQIAASERDQEIIAQLASLSSYDVYSLRSSFKKLGLEVTDPAALELSDEMKGTLGGIAVRFTRPMIEHIFGVGQQDANDVSAWQKLFRDPDIGRVRENLKIMTEKTGIPLVELPKFFEEYSEIFLSVAYYRHSFDILLPEVERFQLWLKTVQDHRDVISSPQTVQSCRKSDESLRFLVNSLRDRLAALEKGFEIFWSDINKSTFQILRQQIEDTHGSLGAVICGLSVKIRHWSSAFADNDVGGPQKRAKYVVTDFEPGLDRLKQIEISARRKADLPMPKG